MLGVKLMEITPLDIRQREAAEEVWALQHPAYRVEADLIGVADLPRRKRCRWKDRCIQTIFGEIVGEVLHIIQV